MVRNRTVRRSALGKVSTCGKTARTGFTLVEMLVVIAIIGILIGMTLPGVNMMREQGRQTSCKNKLRQMYIACEAHNAQYDCFPPGLPSCTPPDKQWYTGGTQKSLEDELGSWCQGPNWITALLPFMGLNENFDAVMECLETQSNAADECEHSGEGRADFGGRVTLHHIICPSSPVLIQKLGPVNKKNIGAGTTEKLEVLAKGNYAANYGLSNYDMAITLPGDRDNTGHILPGPTNNHTGTMEELKRVSRGAFQVESLQNGPKARFAYHAGDTPLEKDCNGTEKERCYGGRWKLGSGEGVRTNEFKDGLSHTLMISEVYGWDSMMDIRGVWAVSSPGASVFTALLRPNSKAPASVTTDTERQNYMDKVLVCGSESHISGDVTKPQIPRGHPLECTENRANGDVYAAARSMHPGGVNAVMADGATRWFAENIDRRVWQALSTRAGMRIEYSLDFPF